MIKICFFSGDITRSGGTERVSSMIANAFSKKRGFQVFFLSLTEQEKEPFFPLDSAIQRTALGNKWLSPGPAYLKMIPLLRRYLITYGIDILIDIDIVLDILSVPAVIGLKTKVISWEHFNYPYESTIFYRKFILKHFTNRTDFIVTLTEKDAEIFRERMHRNNRIQAIYNPIEKILPVGMDKRQANHKENALITVGRLCHFKGTDRLAQIAKHVLKAHPDWKWYVIGEGEDRQILESVIQESHLGQQLILTGRLKEDELDDYWERAKICVLTSRAEGLPMCLLEAKTHRLPIVSFDILTGPNEMIEDGKNGYLVSASNCKEMAGKIHSLIIHPDMLESFSKHSLDNIEKFQMEKIINQWNRLFRSLYF